MLMLSFYLFFLLVSLNLLIERGLNFNLPLIFKDSVTDMHGLSIYVKEGLPFFLPDVSWKSSVGFCLCFRLGLFHSASYFFFLYWSLHFIHGFWGYLGYNRWASLDQAICRSHKDWQTYTGETDILVNSVTVFLF